MRVIIELSDEAVTSLKRLGCGDLGCEFALGLEWGTNGGCQCFRQLPDWQRSLLVEIIPEIQQYLRVVEGIRDIA